MRTTICSRSILALVLYAMFACAAWAQPAWRPDKAVEIILPTAPGGFNDQIARLIHKVVQDEKMLAVPMVIMNRPGGNQTLAPTYLAQRAGDGNYLLYTTPTIITNQLAGITPLQYSEFSPIALLLVEHTVITVRADSPLRNMRDLIERLKADPESIAFGTVSRGGPNHLSLSQAVKAAGLDAKKLKAVVFKTNAESIMAVVGGHIQGAVTSASAALPQAQAGNTRMLAIAGPRRMAGALATVATLREQGIEADGLPNWRGIFGAKGLTPAQIAFWEEALARTVANPDWKKLLDESNLATQFLRSREFLKYLEGEYAVTKALMTDLALTK
jgi:putative tricarboxylic transport membrane protein